MILWSTSTTQQVPSPLRMQGRNSSWLFPVVASKRWNELPLEIRTAESLTVSKQGLNISEFVPNSGHASIFCVTETFPKLKHNINELHWKVKQGKVLTLLILSLLLSCFCRCPDSWYSTARLRRRFALKPCGRATLWTSSPVSSSEHKAHLNAMHEQIVTSYNV